MGIWIVPMGNNYLIWGVVNAYENSLLICISCLILRLKINSMLCGAISVCKNHLLIINSFDDMRNLFYALKFYQCLWKTQLSFVMFWMLKKIKFVFFGAISVYEKYLFDL